MNEIVLNFFRMEAYKSKWDSAATDDEKEEASKPEVDATTRVKQENEEDSDLRYAAGLDSL